MIEWAWLFRRYWYMWAFMLLTLVAGIWFEKTRWNMVASLWSVFIAGTVVSLLLEGHGDTYRRRRWLRKHLRDLQPVIDTILNTAGLTAAFAIGLPDEVQLQLRQGETRAVRAQAAARALELACDLAEKPSESAMQRIERAHLLVPDMANFARTVDEMVQTNLGLLRDLTDLLGAVQRYSTACRMFLGSPVGRGAPPTDIGRMTLRYLLPQLGSAAVALCEKCSDIYCDAESLPKG